VNAGVIEGFFGRPWEWPTRLNGVDFLRDWGYQFYIYAPKGDPFLRRGWREPMPEETLRSLAELAARGAAREISVGVGLTPFEIYLNYDADARTALRDKVRQINATGVDMLCILFDDMRGDVNELASLQARVAADICGWSNARHFILGPTYYSYDSRLIKAFGPPPKDYLRDLGRTVDTGIDIFWTGEKVISDGYSAAHLAGVSELLRRKPFIWDNSISNDSRIRTNHLYLDPTAGAWQLPDLVAGLAINPMNQAHLTRFALVRFRRLLAKRETSGYRDLCGSEFASQLLMDAALFRETGLDQMDASTRRELLARYESVAQNPYAQEIVSWLRGDYVFDPQCLTT
jgi:hyaluronoglucosaminidase